MPDRGGIKVKVRGDNARFHQGTWTGNARLLEVLQQATDIRGYEALPSDPAGEFHVLGILRDYGGEVVEIEPAEPGVPGRIH